jgi:maleylpyruvate isomerase
MMILYNYFRSSASYRVRIALALKGLPYDYRPVHLAKGEHLGTDYGALAADSLVPLLVDGDLALSQSLAIMEYLDETHPTPALLPADPLGRARVRALALSIACEIHPLNNLRVLKHLGRAFKATEEDKNTWYRHWIAVGLVAFERQLELLRATDLQAVFCYGNQASMADCCLVPQIFNAKRFNCDLSAYPLTMAAFDQCMTQDAFIQSQPSLCPDYFE